MQPHARCWLGYIQMFIYQTIYNKEIYNHASVVMHTFQVQNIPTLRLTLENIEFVSRGPCY